MIDPNRLISTIQDLKNALSEPRAFVPRGEGNFEKLSESLLSKFQIQKGKQLYWMTDIEFYIYTDDHRDIITYPRNTEAGEWFFHASGVDISFKSKVDLEIWTKKQKPVLSKDSVFGGILIRGIVPAYDGAQPIDGPMKVCDELFDKFDAFATPTDFPRIVEARTTRVNQPTIFKEKRKNLNDNPEKKVKSILYNYKDIDKAHISETDLIAEYGKHLVSEYRFFVPPSRSSK